MGRYRNNKSFFDSQIVSTATYLQYYNKLYGIAITSFLYDNMPLTVDKLYFQRRLFDYGQMLYFRDEVMGDLILPFSGSGKLSPYGEPFRRQIYSDGDYKNRRNRYDSVIIYSHASRLNLKEHLSLYAMRMFHCDLTADINVEAQKTPILIKCRESMKLTMKNLYTKYKGNQPVVLADKSLTEEDFKVLKTDAPYVADKMQTLKENIWNDALTFLGVSNVHYQKKERVNTDEVNRGMGGTFACRQARLLPQEYAFGQINDMFGTNITVKFNESADVVQPNVTQDQISQDTDDLMTAMEGGQ